MFCFQIKVEIHAPGLEHAIASGAKEIADALHGIAEAIDGLTPPPPQVPQITGGHAAFDPQTPPPRGA